MSKSINVTTTTAILAAAMYPESGLAAFNAGVYEGTRIRIRQLTGNEVVTVRGMSNGASVITTETWIEDRFGPLGARQIKRLMVLVSEV